MTTEELVNMDLPAFGDTIAKLDVGSSERHARDLFHRLGGPGPFEDYLREVLAATVLSLGAADEQMVAINAINDRWFPSVPAEYDLLGRLTLLVLRVISGHFESLHLPPRGRGG